MKNLRERVWELTEKDWDTTSAEPYSENDVTHNKQRHQQLNFGQRIFKEDKNEIRLSWGFCKQCQSITYKRLFGLDYEVPDSQPVCYYRDLLVAN